MNTHPDATGNQIDLVDHDLHHPGLMQLQQHNQLWQRLFIRPPILE